MIEKLAQAFTKVLGEIKEIRAEMQNMPVPKDGISPDPKEIAAQVLALIPTPKDGKDGTGPSAREVAALIPSPKDGKDGTGPSAREVAALIPSPKDGKDGRDAQPVLLADLAAVLLPQIPKPKDGRDGTSPSAQAIAAQVQTPRPGKDGKDGVSVTDVKLERNTLFVWLDGVKKAVGKIDLSKLTQQPQVPMIGGGSRTKVKDPVVQVRSLKDLPNPTLEEGVLTIVLEDKQYRQNNDIDSPYPLAYPGAGNRTTWTSVNRAVWRYTGTDACFRDKDAKGDFELQGLIRFEAPNGNIWDLDSTTGGGSWSFQASDVPGFRNFKAMGTVKGGVGGGAFNIHFGSIVDYDQGLIAENLFFFEINQVFVFGNNAVGCTHFTVQGVNTTGSVNFITPTVTMGTNETVFNIKPEIQAGIDSLNFRGCQQEGGINGAAFAPGSLTQKSLKTIAIGNNFIANSRIIGSASIKNNVNATTIPVSGTFNDIEFDPPGVSPGSNIERFTLTDDSNCELRVDAETEFDGVINLSYSATSTGGARVFHLRWVKNGLPLEDDIISALEIGSTIIPASMTVPVQAVKGDLLKPQVTRVDGTSTVTFQQFSVNIQ